MIAKRDPRGRTRARQSDIAELAGVSQATVSLIVNGRDAGLNIGLDTRSRVLNAARQLGYVANPAARKLAGGANEILGVYTFEPVFPTDHRDFYHPFLRGIEEAAAAGGFDLLLFTSAGPDGARSIYRDGSSRLLMADGCILLGRHAPVDELAQLVRSDFPVVFIGRRDVPGGGLTYVTGDYASATAELVGHLVDLGHRRIAYVGEHQPQEPSIDRERGFRAGLAGAGLPDDKPVVHRGDSDSVTARSLQKWLDAGVTAFCCEVFLVEALEAAAEALGLTAPDDFSLCVLGDRPGYVAGEDTRTRFSIPRREIGVAAVDKLRHLLEAWPERPGPSETLLPCTFLPGHSSGPAPADN